MSVVSSVNPSYFSGLNAFADQDGEEEVNDDSGGSSNNDNEVEADSNNGADDENGENVVKSPGNHSKVTLEIDDNAELQIEIEDGDLDNGTYDVIFACDNSNVDEEFTDALVVNNGGGEFKKDPPLTNGTYSDCEVGIGDLSATFPSFTITANEDDDNEEEDGNRGSSTGPHDEEDDEHDSKSGKGSHNGSSDDDKSKQRKQIIINSTSGVEIHERHRSENAASPGDYKPRWNYTLKADGEATPEVDDENLVHEANATVSVDMSLWKSNRAIILLDIVGGTVEVEGQDYNVRIGYAIYSTSHDAMKIAALATDDNGNVFRFKLRGSAADGSDQFPMETGSIDMVFGGDVNNRFEDWNLLLEGTIEAN